MKTLQEERAKLIQERRDIKKEITRKHLLFAQKINENLRTQTGDFFVAVKYKENVYSPEFEDI